MRKRVWACALGAVVCLSACKSDGAMDTVKSAGSTVAEEAGGLAASLVNVDLSNVLNDLALDLNIDKANVPINAQIPINVAANICGININILSIGGSGSSEGCTANSVSPELVQAIQQQLAANGNVGGGAQTNGGTTSGSTDSGTATRSTTTVPTSGTSANVQGDTTTNVTTDK